MSGMGIQVAVFVVKVNVMALAACAEAKTNADRQAFVSSRIAEWRILMGSGLSESIWLEG
jgi:hypothetical protein